MLILFNHKRIIRTLTAIQRNKVIILNLFQQVQNIFQMGQI